METGHYLSVVGASTFWAFLQSFGVEKAPLMIRLSETKVLLMGVGNVIWVFGSIYLTILFPRTKPEPDKG